MHELVTRKLTWGEDRAFYDSAGALKSFLGNVTDLIPQDDFDRVSAGRSAFRLDDLLELRRCLDKMLLHEVLHVQVEVFLPI